MAIVYFTCHCQTLAV